MTRPRRHASIAKNVFFLAASVTLLLPAACSQRVVSEEEYARQERERPLLTPAEAPPRPREAGLAGQEIRGVVEGSLDAGMAGDGIAGDSAVLYLFVRPAGATAGPPLAAQRLPAGPFPVHFAIGPGDAMIAGTSFPERVTVEARLDRDGDPLTTGPGDWTARSGPVEPGAEGVRLELVP